MRVSHCEHHYFPQLQRDTSDSRIIHQFQFLSWPENGAPKTGAAMIDLIGQVLRVQQQTGNKPIVVHCRYAIKCEQYTPRVRVSI